MSDNPNRYGAPPPDSMPGKRIECPVLFVVLEIIGILFCAAAWLFLYIIL
jgi:hypothetical protein